MARGTILAAIAALLAGVAVIFGGSSGSSGGHRVSVVVPDAANLIPGNQVRAGGQAVGEVTSVRPVRGGAAARIELRIEDEAWPLRRGMRMQVRSGGTIAYNNRHIELGGAPAGAPPIPDGGRVSASDFSVPVEFDSFLSTFTPSVRRDLRAMMDNAGAAYARAAAPLRRALGSAPPALVETGTVLEDLEDESVALGTLVRSGDRVVNAVRRADPGIGRLVTGAATTFDAVADQAEAMRAALRQMPRTLAATRTTLARAESTLTTARELSDRLAPGVAELRRFAPPLTGLLRTTLRVGPDARTALATARRAAPSLTPTLRRLRELMPRFAGIGRQSAEQVKCIRPHAPEIAAYFSTWGDWTSNTDGGGTYTRIASQAPPYGNAETSNSAEIAARNPGLTYAFPRPPGMLANQPWFLPECRIGPEALDPAQDPEARR